MKVSVIITAYRAPLTLKRVLQGYQRQSIKPDEIIIAEDAEDLNLLNIVPIRSKKDLKFIHISQTDDGYRRSRILNKAIATSEGDYIILSDADCIPHKKFVRDHIRFAKANHYTLGTRAYVTQEIADHFKPTLPRRIYHTLKGNLYPKKISFRVPLINWSSNTSPLGANMAFWKTDLIKVNGFNNDFIGWGHEDMELLDRMKNAGVKERFLHQQCILYHLNHPFLSREDSSANTHRWHETKAAGSKWCENGLDQYKDMPKESLIKASFSA